MVEWPIALDGDGEIVHIDDAMPGMGYKCYDCAELMFPRFGESGRAHHFYHQVAGDCSSSETDLHRIAKELIIDGVETIRGSDSVYLAEVTCRHCGDVAHRIELRGDISYAIAETYASPRLCPDVSLFSGGSLVATVEVVVTHPPSPRALNEYQELGLPAFIVRPTWESVSLLQNGITTNEGLNVADMCNRCLPAPTPDLDADVTSTTQKQQIGFETRPAVKKKASAPVVGTTTTPGSTSIPARPPRIPTLLELLAKVVEDAGPVALALLATQSRGTRKPAISKRSSKSNPSKGTPRNARFRRSPRFRPRRSL